MGPRDPFGWQSWWREQDAKLLRSARKSARMVDRIAARSRRRQRRRCGRWTPPEPEAAPEVEFHQDMPGAGASPARPPPDLWGVLIVVGLFCCVPELFFAAYALLALVMAFRAVWLFREQLNQLRDR
ncbi:MAG TPA: hypothetical protein VM165_10070 [Planctomycetaceae bacterium]|nr:hypothetical protein [Planctomycetaceae bacterium]